MTSNQAGDLDPNKRELLALWERSILPEILHIRLPCCLFFIINFSLLFCIPARESSCSTIFYRRKWRWSSWWWIYQWETIQNKWSIRSQQSIKVILNSLAWLIFCVSELNKIFSLIFFFLSSRKTSASNITQGFGLSFSKKTPPEVKLKVSMGLWLIGSSGSIVLWCHLANAFLYSDMFLCE